MGVLLKRALEPRDALGGQTRITARNGKSKWNLAWNSDEPGTLLLVLSQVDRFGGCTIGTRLPRARETAGEILLLPLLGSLSSLAFVWSIGFHPVERWSAGWKPMLQMEGLLVAQ